MKAFFSVFIFITVFRIPVNSQTDLLERRISVHCSELTIKEIIHNISNQDKIRFSYTNLKDLNKRKSIYFKNAKVKFVLARLFEDTDIRYMAFSDQIILMETKKFPQKKFISGYIVETETNLPIPYATIMYLKSGEGLISDYKGRFELELNINTADTLKFTSLSYSSKKISVNKIINKNAIKISLNKKIYPIPEVNIKASDYSELFLGNGGYTYIGALYLDTHGQEVALLIENKKKIKGKIKELHFRLSPKGNTEAPFRIRIFEKDSTGRPGKDILKDILVVKPETKKLWYTVNITDYDIFLPEEGMFISMGGVFPNDYNFYFEDSDFDNISSEDVPRNTEKLSYGQRICYNKKSKNNTWHYSLSRKWFQIDKKRFNVMIRAKINYKKTTQ